jgi:hypothetical protein
MQRTLWPVAFDNKYEVGVLNPIRNLLQPLQQATLS